MPLPSTDQTPPSRLRVARRRRAEQRAAEQAGIVTWRQLHRLGITRSEVRANVAAGRWCRVGRQCVCIHRGPLDEDARRWLAVLEAGPTTSHRPRCP